MSDRFVYILTAFDRSASKEWAESVFESAEEAEELADRINAQGDSPFFYLVKSVPFYERRT